MIHLSGKNKIADTQNGTYASQINVTDSNITDNTNQKTTSNSKQNINRNESYTKTVVGNAGISTTSQRMILEYRKTIRATTKEICERLEPLFMRIILK